MEEPPDAVITNRMARYRRWLGGWSSLLRQYTRLSFALMGYFSQPGFLILGAQKCGTVALFNYLGEHPQIKPAMKKEVSFFNKDALYQRGLAWYHSHFPLPATDLTFEATPEYLYNPRCAKRIYAYNPDIKMIVLLRDPIDRAFSAWNMFRVLNRDQSEYLRTRLSTANASVRKGFEMVLGQDSFLNFTNAARWEIDQSPSVEEQPEPSFLRRGVYAQQLKRYLALYPRDQLLVIESERLQAETAVVLDEVTAFLHIEPHKWDMTALTPRHIGRYEGEELDPQTRFILSEYFAPHNAELYNLLGEKFEW